MFADLNVEKVSNLVFSKESKDKKGYILYYYDLYDDSEDIKTLLFHLRLDKGRFLISGCNLILDIEDNLSPAEALKFENAIYIVNKFNLFNYSIQ